MSDTAIRRAWRGEERLARVMIWGVWVSILVGAAYRGGMKGAAGPSNDTSDPSISILLIQLLVFAPFGIWLVIAWRCAANVINKRWTGIVRLLLAISAGTWAISIIYDNLDVHREWVARSTSEPSLVVQARPDTPQAQPDAPLLASPAVVPVAPPAQPEWVMSADASGDVIHRFTTSAGDVAYVRQLDYSKLASTSIWNWLTQWYVKEGYRVSGVQNVVLDNGTKMVAAMLDRTDGDTAKGYEYLYLMLNPNGGKWVLKVQTGPEGRSADFDARLGRLITAMTQWQ